MASSFADLNLIDPIAQALRKENYSTPTPIQAQAIPLLLDGHDLLGCAQTGTGKTAAFTLPILQKLHETGHRASSKQVRSLILTPTRELAVQIGNSVKTYGRFLDLRHTVVYGGVGYVPQIRALSQGVDVLVATPGRLMDLLNQKYLRLDQAEILVLDEADRMLDMGFVKDVRKILPLLPKKRQTLLFSATMPKEVAHLADSVLKDPKKIQVNTACATADKVDDQVLFVARDKKGSLLLEVLRKDEVQRTIVFTRTKHRADRISRQLNRERIRCEAIHGDKSQNARQKALKGFTTGKVKVLVATDIVSRGIDVQGVSHVINYELPNEPESYVHRIGRTARAGTEGVAISFCDHDEAEYLVGIEKLLKRKVRVCDDHEHHAADIAKRIAEGPKRKSSNTKKRRPAGRSSGGRSAGGRGGRSAGGRSEGGRSEGRRSEGGRAEEGRAEGGRSSSQGKPSQRRNAQGASGQGASGLGASEQRGNSKSSAGKAPSSRPASSKKRGAPGQKQGVVGNRRGASSRKPRSQGAQGHRGRRGGRSAAAANA